MPLHGALLFLMDISWLQSSAGERSIMMKSIKNRTGIRKQRKNYKIKKEDILLLLKIAIQLLTLASILGHGC